MMSEVARGGRSNERPIVPFGVTMVVLDTCAARQLVHEPGVTWDACFKEMSADGYSFSLSELAVHELVSQVQRGSISVEDHLAMLVRLTSFLNPEAPVIPSYYDVMGMIGAREFDEFETRHLIGELWRIFRADFSCDSHASILTERVRGDEVREWAYFLEDITRHVRCSGLDISQAAPEVAADALAVLAASSRDEKESVVPDMSIRQHLEIRYRFRQAARSQLDQKPYRPASTKKRNDALDLSMYSYLTLPAFVVTRDNGFMSKLAGIDSFQRDWFKLPEDLAASWRRGERPAPQWPSAQWIKKEKERSLMDFLVPRSSFNEEHDFTDEQERT